MASLYSCVGSPRRQCVNLTYHRQAEDAKSINIIHRLSWYTLVQDDDDDELKTETSKQKQAKTLRDEEAVGVRSCYDLRCAILLQIKQTQQTKRQHNQKWNLI